MDKFKLTYPDSAVRLWKWRNEASSGISDAEADGIWRALEDELAPAARKVAEKFRQAEAIDLQRDFVVELVRRWCPSEIRTAAILIRSAKKFWAEKYNPAGKEVSDALGEALHTLVQAERIRALSVGKTATAATAYCLATCEKPVAAGRKSCLAAAAGLPKIGVRRRDAATGNRCMVRPKEAEELVLRLLERLGGTCCVERSILLNCLLDRTYLMPTSFTAEYKEEVDAGDEAESGPAKGSAPKNVTGSFAEYEWRDAQTRFKLGQLNALARGTSERIWKRVEKANGDKVFCLYTLPTRMKLSETRLKDLGMPISTAQMRDAKVWNIMKDELSFLLERPEEYETCNRDVYGHVIEGLFGRCTGKGYEMPSYDACTEKGV